MTLPRAAIFSFLLLALITTVACASSALTQEELQAEVVSALDALAAELVKERPADAAAYTERLRSYLDAYPAFFGIGGSPGESVFVKAGASTVEPVAAEERNRYLRMNIDKGNQANGGEDMVVLGNVAHGEVVNREYRIKTLDNMDQPLSVSTDGEGRVWLIVGTDSGFEGLSAFYYSRISYTLSIVEPPKTGGYRPPVWAVVLVAGIGVALAGLGLMAMRLRTRR